MSLDKFAKKGGFKLLAVARLGAASYALVCYLLNSRAAKIEQLMSSPQELAIMLGVSLAAVNRALEELEHCAIIKVTRKSGNTCVIALDTDAIAWKNLRKEPEKRKKSHLGDAKNITPLKAQAQLAGSVPLLQVLSAQEALVFPAKHSKTKKTPGTKVWECFFAQHKPFSGDRAKEREYAKILAESYPVEQVISLIKYYKTELSSLALLAGAWLHYAERFESDTRSVDSMEAFRSKGQSALRHLRETAQLWVKRFEAKKLHLTEDEQMVLRILLRHKEPRTQLYWAIKSRERYTNLQEFFDSVQQYAKPVRK